MLRFFLFIENVQIFLFSENCWKFKTSFFLFGRRVKILDSEEGKERKERLELTLSSSNSACLQASRFLRSNKIFFDFVVLLCFSIFRRFFFVEDSSKLIEDESENQILESKVKTDANMTKLGRNYIICIECQILVWCRREFLLIAQCWHWATSWYLPVFNCLFSEEEYSDHRVTETF